MRRCRRGTTVGSLRSVVTGVPIIRYCSSAAVYVRCIPVAVRTPSFTTTALGPVGFGAFELVAAGWLQEQFDSVRGDVALRTVDVRRGRCKSRAASHRYTRTVSPSRASALASSAPVVVLVSSKGTARSRRCRSPSRLPVLSSRTIVVPLDSRFVALPQVDVAGVGGGRRRTLVD